MRSSSGIGVRASSGRCLQSPRSAERITRPSATVNSDDVAYGRSLTYWASAKSGVLTDVRVRSSACASTSSISAAVQRCSVASG